MSDLHVWELCKHGFAYNCPRFIDAEIMPERCPGGREIVLRQKLFQDVDAVGEVFTFAYEVVEEA